MENTVNMSLSLHLYYYENEKGKVNRVTLTISILKRFFTIVGDEKIVTHFFGEVKRGGCR